MPWGWFIGLFWQAKRDYWSKSECFESRAEISTLSDALLSSWFAGFESDLQNCVAVYFSSSRQKNENSFWTWARLFTGLVTMRSPSAAWTTLTRLILFGCWASLLFFFSLFDSRLSTIPARCVSRTSREITHEAHSAALRHPPLVEHQKPRESKCLFMGAEIAIIILQIILSRRSFPLSYQKRPEKCRRRWLTRSSLAKC